MNHLYRPVPLARELGASALALCSGEGRGPAVRVRQCFYCCAVEFETEEVKKTYLTRGMLSSVEPACQKHMAAT